jgi:hypothetical protein
MGAVLRVLQGVGRGLSHDDATATPGASGRRARDDRRDTRCLWGRLGRPWCRPAQSSSGRLVLPCAAVPGQAPVRINRRSRRMVIQVDDGTCRPGHRDLARRRLDHVRVVSRSDAVFIVVWMRQERPLTDQACFGIGQSFRLGVRLPTPLGHRALVSPIQAAWCSLPNHQAVGRPRAPASTAAVNPARPRCGFQPSATSSDAQDRRIWTSPRRPR